MHTAQIILEYVKALQWPVLMGGILFGFRRTLRYVLEQRLTEVNGPGVSARFEQAADEAAELATASSETTTPRSTEDEQGKEIYLVVKTYHDARGVGDHLRAGAVVILDTTQISTDDAKRIVDFTAGMIFSSQGAIERIRPRVYRVFLGSAIS